MEKQLKKVMRSDLCAEFLEHNEVNCCSLIDSESEGRFSWRGCTCCNTRLGNTVYECNGYDPKNKQVVELGDVCGECIQWFYNAEDSEVIK